MHYHGVPQAPINRYSHDQFLLEISRMDDTDLLKEVMKLVYDRAYIDQKNISISESH